MTNIENIYSVLKTISGKEVLVGDKQARVTFTFEEDIVIRSSGLPPNLSCWTGRRFADWFDQSRRIVTEDSVLQAIREVCDDPARRLAIQFAVRRS